MRWVWDERRRLSTAVHTRFGGSRWVCADRIATSLAHSSTSTSCLRETSETRSPAPHLRSICSTAVAMFGQLAIHFPALTKSSHSWTLSASIRQPSHPGDAIPRRDTAGDYICRLILSTLWTSSRTTECEHVLNTQLSNETLKEIGFQPPPLRAPPLEAQLASQPFNSLMRLSPNCHLRAAAAQEYARAAFEELSYALRSGGRFDTRELRGNLVLLGDEVRALIIRLAVL